MVHVPTEASLLSLSLGTLTAGAVAVVSYQWLLSSRPRLPPGTHAPRRAPSCHWLLGDIPALLHNATRYNDWVFDTTRACGEMPWLQAAPMLPDTVIVATPALVDDVTRTQHDVFGKGDQTRTVLLELLGDSFFGLDGAAWFHQRKTATKFFSAKMYRDAATPIAHACVARALATLAAAQHNGDPVNLSAVVTVEDPVCPKLGNRLRRKSRSRGWTKMTGQ